MVVIHDVLKSKKVWSSSCIAIVVYVFFLKAINLGIDGLATTQSQRPQRRQSISISHQRTSVSAVSWCKTASSVHPSVVISALSILLPYRIPWDGMLTSKILILDIYLCSFKVMAVVRACAAQGVNNAWRDVQSTYSSTIYGHSAAGKSHLIASYHQTKCVLHMATLHGYYLRDKRKDGQVWCLQPTDRRPRVCAVSECSVCPFWLVDFNVPSADMPSWKVQHFSFPFTPSPLSCVNWWHWASSAAPGVLRMHNMNALVYT